MDAHCFQGANLPVTIHGIHDGQDLGTSYLGSTNSGVTLIVTGLMESWTIGHWVETLYVGGVQAVPRLEFNMGMPDACTFLPSSWTLEDSERMEFRRCDLFDANCQSPGYTIFESGAVQSLFEHEDTHENYWVSSYYWLTIYGCAFSPYYCL